LRYWARRCSVSRRRTANGRSGSSDERRRRSGGRPAREAAKPGKITIIVHSGDFDKTYSAFIVGNGALAMGLEASMYFTFWGLSRLKKG
jgi:hypothetical protein